MRDVNVEKIVKYRYFPSICYGRLEKWLEKMSADGYELIDYGFFKYVFKNTYKKQMLPCLLIRKHKEIP